MQAPQNNIPNIDPSGLFNTYTDNSGNIQDTSGLIHPETIYAQNERIKTEKNQEPKIIKIIRIVMEGCVRIIKVAAGSLVIMGCLFVVTLATNTTEKAISIINSTVGSRIIISGEVTVDEKIKEVPSETIGGMTSSALNTEISNPISNDATEKRKAILEARKTARLVEEKQKALEKISQ